MGARGPARKPAELEDLHGNPGHRKNGGNLQFPKPSECPKPPQFLDAIAKREWKRCAPQIFKVGILTEADISAFAAYCASYSTWVHAEKALQAKKTDSKSPAVLTYVNLKGVVAPLPEIGIAQQAKKDMLTFAREFGLTPSARANMQSAEETVEAHNSIMEFMGKKGIKAVK